MNVLLTFWKFIINHKIILYNFFQTHKHPLKRSNEAYSANQRRKHVPFLTFRSNLDYFFSERAVLHSTHEQESNITDHQKTKHRTRSNKNKHFHTQNHQCFHLLCRRHSPNIQQNSSSPPRIQHKPLTIRLSVVRKLKTLRTEKRAYILPPRCVG